MRVNLSVRPLPERPREDLVVAAMIADIDDVAEEVISLEGNVLKVVGVVVETMSLVHRRPVVGGGDGRIWTQLWNAYLRDANWTWMQWVVRCPTQRGDRLRLGVSERLWFPERTCEWRVDW